MDDLPVFSFHQLPSSPFLDPNPVYAPLLPCEKTHAESLNPDLKSFFFCPHVHSNHRPNYLLHGYTINSLPLFVSNLGMETAEPKIAENPHATFTLLLSDINNVFCALKNTGKSLLPSTSTSSDLSFSFVKVLMLRIQIRIYVDPSASAPLLFQVDELHRFSLAVHRFSMKISSST